MNDALVTGATGFIGSRLVQRLRAQGKKVATLSSIDGDVADIDVWKNAPPARILFHLAGRTYVPDSWADSTSFINVNVIGVERALEYCRNIGAKMIFASAYVYGNPASLPIRETDQKRPNNPYALSKSLAEDLCLFASDHYNISATALRLFNVFGPCQKEQFLVPSILSQIRKAQCINIQNLEPRRDYIYIDDVIEAFLLASNHAHGYNCFNIGSGISYSVREIIEIMQRIAGKRLPVMCAHNQRKNEIFETLADISLARELLGWTPKISLQDGIQKILNS